MVLTQCPCPFRLRMRKGRNGEGLGGLGAGGGAGPESKQAGRGAGLMGWGALASLPESSRPHQASRCRMCETMPPHLWMRCPSLASQTLMLQSREAE